MHTSVFAETPDHLRCAMAHLRFTTDVCSVPQKGTLFVITYSQDQWPNEAVFSTGSGLGNGILVLLEISPSPINVHIYPGNQSIPAAIITAQKQMSITVLQVPF